MKRFFFAHFFIVITICIALTLEWSNAAKWMNENSGIAGWVQAIFSVIAIAATGAFLVIENKSNRAYETQQAKEKLRAMNVVISTLADLLIFEIKHRTDFLKARMTTGDRNGFSGGRPFVDIADAAKSFPLHEQSSATQVALIFEMRSLVSNAIELHGDVSQRLEKPSDDYSRYVEIFASTVEALRTLKVNCDDRIRQIKSF